MVSGVATGIDAMAMRGALSKDAPVVGILGCGADVVYPLSNKSLYADTECCGCLLLLVERKVIVGHLEECRRGCGAQG